MTTPDSLKTQPFTSLGSYSFNNILDDDFNYKNPISLKIKTVSAKDATIVYKGKCIPSKSQCGGTLYNEASFQFPFASKYFFWGGFQGDKVKLHLDAGKVTLGNLKVNLFANVLCQKDCQNKEFRVGANYNNENLDASVRVETQGCCPQLALTTRDVYKQGNFALGFVGTLCLKKLNLCKYDGFFNYNHKNTSLFLIHKSPDCKSDCKDQDKCCSLTPGTVQLDIVHKVNDKARVAVEISKNLATIDPHTLVVGGEFKLNNKLTLKAKTNCSLEASVSGIYKLNDSTTLKLSSFGKLNNFSASKDNITGCPYCPCPIGLSIDLNV